MAKAAGEPEEALARMRAIADALAAAGLDARLHQSRAGVDVTATVRPDGQRELQAVVDEDGYVELRYWNRPGASPDHVCAVITSALAGLADACRDRP